VRVVDKTDAPPSVFLIFFVLFAGAGNRLVAKWGDKDENWKKELAKFDKGGKDLAEFAPPGIEG
jgi:hypothetical protein